MSEKDIEKNKEKENLSKYAKKEPLNENDKKSNNQSI